MPTSTGLEKQKDLINKEPYKAQDQESYNFYIQRVETARIQRQAIYKEFDDLLYDDDYELNKQALNSYLRKKRNDDEVRVSTGTTEKKIESVMIDLLGMNLQPEVKAFDKNDLEVEDLGTDFEDLIKRTNEIEKDDDFRVEAVQELISQRALYVEEYYDERTHDDKDSKEGEETVGMARKRVLSGLQVFLGDLTIPAYLFDTQPYIIKYDRLTYLEAETIFKNNPNWKYVVPGMPTNNSYSMNYKYRFGTLREQEVEILTYMSYADDEYMCIANGVMMDKPGTALPWRYPGYNIKMFVLKPMSRTFAYGKPLTASAKTLQALDNETIRLLIRKFRQAIEPPVGVPGGKIYSKDIWSPGSVVQGVKKDDISVLIDHQGVSKSEMSMYELITRKAEEFIGRSDLSGVTGQHKLTATQAIETQKAAAKNLGLSVLAWTRCIRDMSMLRIYTIVEHYTNPVGQKMNLIEKKAEDVFRNFTIGSGSLGGGVSGKKILQFRNRDLTPIEQKMNFQYEQKQKAKGNNMRIKSINIKKLKEIPLQWYIVVNQQEKEGSSLEKIIFNDQLQQAQAISQITQRPLNPDKIIETFERKWKAKNIFQKAPPPQAGQPMQGGGQPGQPGSGVQTQPPQPGGLQKQSSEMRQQVTNQGIRPGAKQLAGIP